ncbi:MAG: hypothetical protein KF745_11890 [Phycisphaeraceae bacterium]|nr:hypothetical protein [Phycisphaeraceae bacterium]
MPAPSPRPPRRLTQLAIMCFVFACAMQIPLTWAWVYMHRDHSDANSRLLLFCLHGAQSPLTPVNVEIRRYAGVRAISIGTMDWPGVIFEPDATSYDPAVTTQDDPFWPFSVFDFYPAATAPARWPTGVPDREARFRSTGPSVQWTAKAYAIGWPFLSLVGRSDRIPASNAWEQSAVFLLQTPMNPLTGTYDELPLCCRPRWMPFAANAAIYTAFLMLATWATRSSFSALRSIPRRSRGLCPACAYDLRATPPGSPCPECGAGLM